MFLLVNKYLKYQLFLIHFYRGSIKDKYSYTLESKTYKPNTAKSDFGNFGFSIIFNIFISSLN